ncbi:MAG: type II toxin-antitoxin system RelE/ParE family toxin [Patescibacteria group bacterium]
MREISISKLARKFMRRLPPKHERQIIDRITKLGDDPYASDTQFLKNLKPLRRADIGEYRIAYEIRALLIEVVAVGKRNDSEIYKELRRRYG